MASVSSTGGCDLHPKAIKAPEQPKQEDAVAEFERIMSTQYSTFWNGLRPIEQHMAREAVFVALSTQAAELATVKKELEEEQARYRAEHDAACTLREICSWLLGESGEFPERPDRIEGKPYPHYWWRGELRRRLAALLK